MNPRFELQAGLDYLMEESTIESLRDPATREAAGRLVGVLERVKTATDLAAARREVEAAIAIAKRHLPEAPRRRTDYFVVALDVAAAFVRNTAGEAPP